MAGEFTEVKDPAELKRLDKLFDQTKDEPGTFTEVGSEASDRLTPTAAKAPYKLTPAAARDMAVQAPAGLIEGLQYLAGLPGDVSEMIGRGVRGGLRYAGVNVPSEENAAAARARLLGGMDIAAPTSQAVQDAVPNPLPEAKTPEGKLTRSATSFVPQAVAMPGRAIPNALLGLVSGAASEGAGQYAQENDPQNEMWYRVGAPLGVGAVASSVPNRLAQSARSRAIPTTTKLNTAGDDLRAQADALGVDLSPTNISRDINKMHSGLLADFHPTEVKSLAPTIADKASEYAQPAAKPLAAMTKVNAAPKAPVPVRDIDAFRKQLNRLAQNAETATERHAARTMRTQADQLVNPGNALSGDAAKAARLLSDARGNEAAAFRADLAAGRALAGDLRAVTSNTGATAPNPGRQALRTLITPIKGQGLKTEAQLAGMNAAEIAKLNKIVRGDTLDNWLRSIGGNTLVSGGIGAGSAYGAYATGNPWVLAPWAAMRAAKYMSGRRLKRHERELDEMLRLRSPEGYKVTLPPQRLNASPTGGLLSLPAAQRQLLLDSENED